MGRIVIACYKPKEGRADELRALVREHVPALRREGLVTDRVPVVMTAADGTIAEVFEWASAEAIEQAHSNPSVGELWERFGEVCEWVPIGSIDEARRPFSEFNPVD